MGRVVGKQGSGRRKIKIAGGFYSALSVSTGSEFAALFT
jgi:hypothetical protein